MIINPLCHQRGKKVEVKVKQPLDLVLPEGMSPVHVLPDPERVERRPRLFYPEGVAPRGSCAPYSEK